MRWMQIAWWLIALGGLLAFADAPFLTFGQKFRVQKAGERLVLMAFEMNLVLLWAIATFYLGWDRPLVTKAIAPPAAFAGVAFALLGALLAVWAKVRLGRWFSATFGVKEGHVLVTDGPYAIVRHPIYLGLLLTLAGGALVWNRALLLGLAAAMAVPFFFHTAIEEALFERHFGDAYRDYQRRVPRLLPWPRPRVRRAPAPSS